MQITFINLEMATNAHALEVFKQGITNYVEAQLSYLETMTPDGEDQEAVENVNEARKNLGNQALLLLEVNGINVEPLIATIEEDRNPLWFIREILNDPRLRHGFFYIMGSARGTQIESLNNIVCLDLGFRGVIAMAQGKSRFTKDFLIFPKTCFARVYMGKQLFSNFRLT